MSAAIEKDLERHSKEAGIAKSELKQMCLRAGLDQIQRGELQVRALRPDQRSLALVLPRETYTALQRLASASGEAVEGFCVLLLTKAAGSVELSADDFRVMAGETATAGG